MDKLILPDSLRGDEDGPPFDRGFFIKHFHSEEPPACDLYSAGEVPVVELVLINGDDCDVYYFEAFTKRFLVALVFTDPPNCDDFYRAFIRYETIFRVNIRYYEPPRRKLGFKPALPALEEDPTEQVPQEGSA